MMRPSASTPHTTAAATRARNGGIATQHQTAPPSWSKDWMTTVTKENRGHNNNNHDNGSNLNLTSNPNRSASKSALSSERFTTEQLRTMSFRPRTMPKCRNDESISKTSDDVSVVDLVDEDNDYESPRPLVLLLPDGSATTPTTNPAVTMAFVPRPAFSSTNTPPRRRRMSKTPAGGPWTKRFAAIKANQASDVLKLQHTFLNRQQGISFIDLNDPRRKAKTFTDVTILAQKDCHGVALPVIGWGTSSSRDINNSNSDQHNEGLWTVLCYLHNHGPMTGGKPASATMSNAHGWISFTRTTARSVGLQKGLQLRLYDAVLLPMGRAMEWNSDGAEQGTFIAICTQLCERHP